MKHQDAFFMAGLHPSPLLDLMQNYLMAIWTPPSPPTPGKCPIKGDSLGCGDKKVMVILMRSNKSVLLHRFDTKCHVQKKSSFSFISFWDIYSDKVEVEIHLKVGYRVENHKRNYNQEGLMSKLMPLVSWWWWDAVSWRNQNQWLPAESHSKITTISDHTPAKIPALNDVQRYLVESTHTQHTD